MQTQVPGVPPEAVNFMRQVERNRTIEGVYQISAMPRLSETLLDTEGFATVKLEFGDSVGFPSLKGQVTATLTAQCQRCLKPLEISVESQFKFALINSEDEVDYLPEEFEPYIVEGEEQSIIEIIEDELMLSVPMVMAHETDCSDFMKAQDAKGGVREQMQADRETSNPFAALKSLKEDKVN